MLGCYIRIKLILKWIEFTFGTHLMNLLYIQLGLVKDMGVRIRLSHLLILLATLRPVVQFPVTTGEFWKTNGLGLT